MGLRLALLAGLLSGAVACQAPAPPTPTPPTAAAAPTPAPKPTAAAALTATAPPPVAAKPTAATTPTAVPVATTSSRIDVVNAAGAAYRSGDLPTAVALYERVRNTPPGPNEAPPSRAAIDEFAHFR